MLLFAEPVFPSTRHRPARAVETLSPLWWGMEPAVGVVWWGEEPAVGLVWWGKEPAVGFGPELPSGHCTCA